MGEATWTIQLLRNEIETIRCKGLLIQSDNRLIEEMLELRAFRDAHPLPSTNKPSSVAARPKSSVVLHMEARAVFGEYCVREAARLRQKLETMEAGRFDADAKRVDDEERARNDAMGQRAVNREAAAAAAWAREPAAVPSDLFSGFAA